MRCTALIFATKQFTTAITEGAVPGLHFIPNFLDSSAQKRLESESYSLRNSLCSADKPHVIKGRTHLSKYHNLKSDEYYQLISLNENNHTINAQYFARYGEEGHELSYFIGNNNIPAFVKTGLLMPMEELMAVRALRSEKSVISHRGEYELNWNFTFNAYTLAKGAPVIAGFPFHVDIKSNGDITAICTLLSDAMLEIRKKTERERSYAFNLTPGSLFLLSKESRFEWEHRVIPKKIKADETKEKLCDTVSRFSLVLGCS